jgi:hypothetical protein
MALAALSFCTELRDFYDRSFRVAGYSIRRHLKRRKAARWRPPSQNERRRRMIAKSVLASVVALAWRIVKEVIFSSVVIRVREAPTFPSESCLVSDPHCLSSLLQRISIFSRERTACGYCAGSATTLPVLLSRQSVAPVWSISKI